MPQDRPIVSWEGVKRLGVPALVVGVREDPLHPLDMALAWTRCLPNVQFACIPSKYESPQQHVSEFGRHFRRLLEGVIS